MAPFVFVAAWGLRVLFGVALCCALGCGRTERNEHTGEPPVLWSFGDDRTTVLRGTVQDSDGDLYVPTFISDRPVADVGGSLGTGRFLVSKLSPDGELVWQVELAGPRSRPLVVADEVYAYGGDRCSGLERADGAILAETEGWYIPAVDLKSCVPADAVGFDGWTYGLMSIDTTPTLCGLSPESEGDPDFVSELDVRFVENGDSPASYGLPAVTENSLIAACRSDICRATDQEGYGLAAFDLHTGSLKWWVRVDTGRFGDVALDEAGNAYSLVDWGSQRIAITGGKQLEEIDLGARRAWSRLVIGEDGPVLVGQDTGLSALHPAIKVGKNDLAPVDVPWFGGINVALAKPKTIILHAREERERPSLADPVSEWPHHWLVGVSPEGDVLWQYDGASFDPFDVPIPGDGRVFARTVEGRLLAVPAPVEGVDPGPWPMPDGDPGRTRRGR